MGPITPSTHIVLILCRATKNISDHFKSFITPEGDSKLEVEGSLLSSLTDLFAVEGVKFNRAILNSHFEHFLLESDNSKKMCLILRLFANLIPLKLTPHIAMLASILPRFLYNVLERILYINNIAVI